MKFLATKTPTRPPRLGNLEIAILEVVWREARVTARGTLGALRRRGIGLSTVQTTLERLTRKGLLRREKDGRAFAYSARISREALVAQLLRELSDDFATGRIEPLLSGFLSLVDELDPHSAAPILERLQRRLADR